MKLVLLEIVFIIVIVTMGYKAVAKINPECHCYLFQSSGGSHGTFKSPSFPRYYPINVGCILYIFVGAIDELVELTLYEFDMRPLNKENVCTDFFRLYLNLDRPELNMDDHWDFHICGEMQLLPQSVFYSRHRVIVAEFHSTGRYGYNYRFRGFKGNFKFLKRAQFKVDGVHMLASPCRYRFDATSQLTGNFFSPNYPQNYPNNTDCIYEFVGRSVERVIIDFSNIKLEDFRQRCDPITAGDRIVIYDGLSKSDRVLGRFCGLVNARQVVSHGTSLSVHFQSDDNGIQSQGFAAKYEFVNRHSVQPSWFLDDKMRDDSREGYIESCTHQYRSSSNRKTGLFELPETPYEPHTICRYFFTGKPDEIVKVEFRRVRLDNADPKSCRSHSGDRIEVYDGMSEAQNWLAVICGQVKQMKVTSSGRYLTVKFVADDVQSEMERGFVARYNFLESKQSRNDMTPNLPPSTNSIGEMTSSDSSTSQGECRYHIISRQNAKTGTLQTPGYPNGFKDDIVCVWLFYGEPNERVRIKLTDFSLNKERDSDSNLVTDFLPKDSCAGRDRLQIYKFRYQESIGQVTRHEAPIELCGVVEPTYLMSGLRSRLDVIFHSVGGSRSSARGIRFNYMFVTDFGVSAPFAHQKSNVCEFYFDGKKTSNGSFNSPNYPGNYPEDLTCDYILNGHTNQRVSISFADFDVDSEAKYPSCRGAPGDFVEIKECSLSGYRVTGSEYALSKRFCDRPKKDEMFRIDWPKSCLHLRFYSNAVHSKRGFFAYYSFYEITPVQLASNHGCQCKLFNWSALFLIVALLHCFSKETIWR